MSDALLRAMDEQDACRGNLAELHSRTLVNGRPGDADEVDEDEGDGEGAGAPGRERARTAENGAGKALSLDA